MGLLIHPPVAMGEGPLGYLRRLSDANHLTIPEIQRLGVSFDVRVLRQHKCAPLEGLDVTLDKYLCMLSSCVSDSPSSWISRVSRYCPVCLSQHARWKVGWELLFADACPEHQVWLIDVCQCGRVITWDRLDFGKCDCGRPFQWQKPAQCPESVARLSALLLDKALRNPEAPNPGPVGRLSISQLQRLIRFLGTYGDTQPGPRPQKISYQDRLSVSWQITSLAAEILTGWPECLYRILDRLQHERAVVGGGRLSGRFGYLYTALYKAFPEDEFSSLRDAFENYVVDHWRGALGERNRRFPPGMLQRAAWIPSNHACRRLGVSSARLFALIAENRIAGETRVGPSGRMFLMVRREDVDRESEVVADEVDLATVAAMLGVTKRRMLAMLPRLFPEAYKTTNETSPWAIPRERLDRLVAIIGAAKVEPSLSAESTSFARVLKFWAWTDAAMADAVADVIVARLVPTGILKGTKGISGLIFRKADLRDWHGRTQYETSEFMTISDVAARMQVKQEVAYALVRVGLLPTVSAAAERKHGGQLVSKVALESFGRRYVFARDLAKCFGRSPKALIEKLRLLGLNPVCGPQIDGCRQVLYEGGSELENAVNALRVAGWDRI